MPRNLTWQPEHLASISKCQPSAPSIKVITEFSAFCRDEFHVSKGGLSCNKGSVILFKISYPSCLLQKATGAAGGAIPRRRNGKVFLGKSCFPPACSLEAGLNPSLLGRHSLPLLYSIHNNSLSDENISVAQFLHRVGFMALVSSCFQSVVGSTTLIA